MRNLRKRGLKFELSHIKGHQDENCLFHNLDRWAQLNVIADQKAKQRLQIHIINGRDTMSSTYHEEGWSCWLGNTKCEDFFRSDLKDWIFKRVARWYWSYKQYITYTQFDTIDWETIARVMEEKPQLYRCGIPNTMQTGAVVVKIWFVGNSGTQICVHVAWKRKKFHQVTYIIVRCRK